MIPFVYRGFWDVPRFIVFEAEGALYYLECEFSDELDDYPDKYEMYRLPYKRIGELPSDWTHLADDALRLGAVPVVRREPVRAVSRKTSFTATVRGLQAADQRCREVESPA